MSSVIFHSLSLAYNFFSYPTQLTVCIWKDRHTHTHTKLSVTQSNPTLSLPLLLPSLPQYLPLSISFFFTFILILTHSLSLVLTFFVRLSENFISFINFLSLLLNRLSCSADVPCEVKRKRFINVLLQKSYYMNFTK